MKSLGERVLRRRKELGIAQVDLAEMVGMTQQGVQSIEAGLSARPRKLREIARALKTTEAFLLGEDDWLPTAENTKVVENAVPLVGEVAAGVWREHDFGVGTAAETAKKVPIIPYLVGSSLDGLFALRVRGNSMDQTIPDGFLVICRDFAHGPGEPVSGDLVVVERRRMQGGLREVTVKRYRKLKDGFELHPESSDTRWKPVRVRTGKPDADTEIHLLGYVLLIANEPVRR